MNNGNVNNNNKNNTNRVRAVAPVPVVSVSAATSSAVYDISFSSIIEAWLDYEVNKRSSNSCLKFRWHVQRDLKSLWLQMISGEYTPGKSMVFMATYPVMREIWAGASRDRVVHHWEALRYNGPLENYFVWVGDKSMNCRKGYGSLRAVDTFQESIREFTENYTRDDCYIVGGDFKQFFPSISKPLAYSLMEDLLVFSYQGQDLQQLLALLRVTIHHRPQDDYFNISDKSLWDNYPKSKSLFHAEGFAPGNLISQHVANLLGAVFTLWMVFAKKAQGFIIFVDDWKCLVRTQEEGRQLIADAREFLKSELGITLHPDKVYLQHYSKGTPFVGSFIKPGRNYISNRTRGHFITAMRKFNAMPEAQTHAGRMALLEKLRASINSYLGMMVHYKSYKIRRKICEQYILPFWGEYLYFVEDFSKCVIKVKYDRRHVIKHRLRSHKYARKFIRPKWTPQN